MNDYAKWFKSVTTHPAPRLWQRALAERDTPRNCFLRIPTGLGKTEGVLAAWMFHRIFRDDERWPRRLVWCLPMRVLVEQTVQVAELLCANIAEEVRPKIGVLMGGEDMEEWFLQPEKPWILIGTQDMLLSRALNRGYASGRARWPVEFGLLNQDALWVMDEVQLMDVGLATSAQIQAYRDQDSEKALRPSCTWWMSATLQPEWLHSVDTVDSFKSWNDDPVVVNPEDRFGGLWEIGKNVQSESIAADESKEFAAQILKRHSSLENSEFGRITLVVCNTVDRACETYDQLKKAGRTEDLELVHGRFRPFERESWRKEFLSRESCTNNVDRIIVATQVVEAGVDISVGSLITELAPWPSLVQRFGRCARYGGAGSVLVVNRGLEGKYTAPYNPESLSAAWEAVQSLNDAGIKTLEEYEEGLDDRDRARLYPFEPEHLLMRNEFDELFDTTPDLTGADLDISRFIRTGEERDVQVFWVDVPTDQVPTTDRQPLRRELCNVPFLKARDWLCGKETTSDRKPRLRKGMRAWVWDWLDGAWDVCKRESLLPGRIVCVSADCGGYSIERGFSPDSKDAVTSPGDINSIVAIDAVDLADIQHDGEPLSINEWKTIAYHSNEVVDSVVRLADALKLPQDLARVLKIAARWHDIGKSHPAFQGAITGVEGDPRPIRKDLAKGPASAWLKPPGTYRVVQKDSTFEDRPSFRHELASALALFSVLQLYQPDHPALLGPWVEILKEIGKNPNVSPIYTRVTPEIQDVLNCTADEFNLLIYLVCSHHGKVRLALHASPADQDFPIKAGDTRGLPIRGIRNGDILPQIAIASDSRELPKFPLSLDPAAIGLSEITGASWCERSQSLLAKYGPGALGMLEAILRAADVEASRLNTEDSSINTIKTV